MRLLTARRSRRVSARSPPRPRRARAARRAYRPAAELDERNYRRLEALPQLDRVADVIGVAVRDDDQVDALGFSLRLRARRPREPRVDVDTLPFRAVETECRVPEPGQRNGHASR